MVEYETDFFILRPVDPRRASGVLAYYVTNRGRKMILNLVDDASGNADTNNPKTAQKHPRLGGETEINPGVAVGVTGVRLAVAPGNAILSEAPGGGLDDAPCDGARSSAGRGNVEWHGLRQNGHADLSRSGGRQRA